MCVPGVFSTSSALLGGSKKNDREDSNRRSDAAAKKAGATRARDKITGAKRKKNLENFNTNIATRGQNRAANIGS